jgi:hypothetical protein
LNLCKRWSEAGRIIWSGTLVACSVLGCSGFKEGVDTNASVNPNPKWDCLSKPPPTLPKLMSTPQVVVYNVPIFDFANPPSTIPNLSIAACSISDVNCPTTSEVELAPVSGPMPFQTTFGGLPVTVPVYTLLMPYGIDAYLRLRAPGYLQFEYPLGGALISQDGVLTNVPGVGMAAVVVAPILTPVKQTDADRFANQIGITRDPGAALIAVRAVDCQGQPAAGVTLTLAQAGGLAFSYLSNQPLSTNPPSPTDQNGIAGFANIKLGDGLQNFNVTVEATDPNGTKYGKMVLDVRPNQLTSGEIRPFPGLAGR